MDNQKQKVLWIRHAQSQFNLKTNDVDLSYLSDDQIFDKTLMDTSITELGIQQCKECFDQNKVVLQNVGLVIVSPLRRALETSFEIFKNCKNFNQIKFIVDPIYTEALHASCDVGGKIQDSILTFQNYDFSILKNYQNISLWNLEIIKNQEVSSKIKEQIRILCEQNQNQIQEEIPYILIDSIRKFKEQNKDDIESVDDIKFRATLQREKVIKFYSQEYSNYLKDQKSIAVVSHGFNLLQVTNSTIGFKNTEIRTEDIDLQQ